MANLLDFHNEIHLTSGVAPLDFSISLRNKMLFPTDVRIGMRVVSMSLSDRIPNIYDAGAYYNWNNTICGVYTNTHPLQLIRLPRGLYGTVETIAAAINDAINQNLHWWLDPNHPGLSMTANTITDVIRVDIDSARLNPLYGTVFALDLRYSTTGGDLAYTLGFSQAAANLVGGLLPVVHFSNEEVQLDTQGTKAIVCCSIVDDRRDNDGFNRKLATIDFAGKNTISDNLWPPGGTISPLFTYSGRSIDSYKITILTYDGYVMLFMNGGITGSISFGVLGSTYPQLT